MKIEKLVALPGQAGELTTSVRVSAEISVETIEQAFDAGTEFAYRVAAIRDGMRHADEEAERQP